MDSAAVFVVAQRSTKKSGQNIYDLGGQLNDGCEIELVNRRLMKPPHPTVSERLEIDPIENRIIVLTGGLAYSFWPFGLDESLSVEYELAALDRKVEEVWKRFVNTVQMTLGDRINVSFLPIRDRRRLTVLWVWEQRYRVSVEWILEVLLRVYFKARVRAVPKRKIKGLPVSVKTLVSKASEAILQQELNRQYPWDDHIEIWRQYEQNNLLNRLRAEEGLRVQQKTFLDFSSLAKYRQWYEKEMRRRRKWMDTMRREMKATSKPYRGNPW